MEYRLLGRSGLRVSQVCLGTMTFGLGNGVDYGADKNVSAQMFDAFLEAGGNFVDTANLYTQGESEAIVGELIAPHRDRIVLATKYTFTRAAADPNSGGNHRKNLVQALEKSLRKLQTDFIDLYWVHAWDFTTPVDELMRALDDQVRAGKILHVGISDTPAWIVSQANTLALLRGWSPFVALQIEYSLVQRTVERDLVPMARAFDLGICAWSPLGGGLLTGKYAVPDPPKTRRANSVAARINERSTGIVRLVGEIAAERGVSAAQVAIAWVAQRGGDVIPILGAKRVDQLTDDLGALSFELTGEDLKRLDAASAIELGFPHQFLSNIRNGQAPISFYGVGSDSIHVPEGGIT